MQEFSKKTKEEFIQVVGNFYSGVASIGEISDAKEMMDFAIMHQLNALYCSMILGDKEQTYYDTMAVKMSYFANVKVNLALARESERLAEYLRGEDIPFSYIKGQYIRQFYAPSEIRSMGDADIYIAPSGMDKAKAYFEANGYAVTEYYSGVTTYSKGNYEFEVHNEIKWFGVDFSEGGVMTDNGYSHATETAYTIVHAMKHIVGFGCGIRQVLDIALLLRKDSQILSNQAFNDCISGLNISICYNALIGLINRWFGTSYPNTASKGAIDTLEVAILEGGVFGKNLNDYATVSKVQMGSKWKMYYRMIFPKYERMVLSYPALKEKKYLLPYYYIKRLFTRGLKEKRYKIVSRNGGDEATIESRKHFVDILQLEDQYYNNI